MELLGASFSVATDIFSPPIEKCVTLSACTSTRATIASWIFQFFNSPKLFFASLTRKERVKRSPSRRIVAVTTRSFECSASSAVTSSTSMRALDEAMTSSERKPRWSLGSPGSTIAVAALALPSARRSRYWRTFASGVRVQFATVRATVATTPRTTRATTPTTMRLMRRRLLSDIGVKVTPACGTTTA